MAKRRGSPVSRESASSQRKSEAKAEHDAMENENAQRLDKLPREVWEKILGELCSSDLFPLALSCRYFRQKQKELVARARQRGPESGKRGLTLKTSLKQKLDEGQPASADYLHFCRKEKVPSHFGNLLTNFIRYLAAHHGHLPLLQELLDGSDSIDTHLARTAARGGQLETLQWLKAQKGLRRGSSGWIRGPGWMSRLDKQIFFSACEGGHLEVLKWLRSEGCPWSERACSSAAEGGHLEILKWLRSEGCPWGFSACSCAAKGGHLEVLKWLRSEGCPWNARACMNAAWSGRLEILKWLRSEGCPWDAEACSHAASGGRLEVLKWLRSEGCPWNAGACWGAARMGHLEMLKWLRSEGCPWNAGVCQGAAEGGHLEVLKWLRREGCPWDEETWKNATVSTREWLKENGCPTRDFDEYGYGDEYSDGELNW